MEWNSKTGLLGNLFKKGKKEEEPPKEDAVRKGMKGLKDLSSEVERINRERDNRKPKK